MALTPFAEILLQETGELSFDIPAVIPTTATNVLVYVTIDTGKAIKATRQNLKIYTKNRSGQHFEKYIYQYSYTQDAIVTNSENMWFPMPADGKIHLHVDHDAGQNCNFRMFATGYN